MLFMPSRGPYETKPNPEVPTNLSERLRWLRKRLGLTQGDVAESLGCDTAVVSNWELARTRPSSVALGAIAKFYGITPQVLDSGEGFLEEVGKLPPPGQHQESGPAKGYPLAISLESPGTLGLALVDLRRGTQGPVDAAEAVNRLLRFQKQGRDIWIVVR